MSVTAKERLLDFTGYTSMHALGRIGSVKYMAHKLFWTAAFLTSLGICISQINSLRLLYKEYPIKTRITLSHGHVEFPSITVCNLNLVKYSAVKQNPDLNQVIEAINNIKAANAADPDTVTEQPSTANSTLPDFGRGGDYSDQISEAVAYFNGRIATLTDDQMKDIYTIPTEKFIVTCKFGGHDCLSYFSRYRDDEYGLCYQFNPKEGKPVPGRNAGLQILLSVDQGDYTPSVTKSSGVRAALHYANEAPEFMNRGFNLPTGFEIDMEVKPVDMVRLPGPQKLCDKTNKWRSLSECYTWCFIQSIDETCNCTTRRSVLDQAGRHLCSTTKDTECFSSHTMSTGSFLACDQCIAPCNERYFESKFSMAQFPSDQYESVLNAMQHAAFVGKTIEKIRKDLMLLQVYFPSLLSQSVVEEREYTEESFVSDIGGQLGLWIGMSVLSFTEILELIVLMVVACCRRNRKTHDLTGAVESVPEVCKSKPSLES